MLRDSSLMSLQQAGSNRFTTFEAIPIVCRLQLRPTLLNEFRTLKMYRFLVENLNELSERDD